MRLKNKTVLITGSGSGQGRAAAKLFAGEGANVVVFDINEEGAQQTVEEILSKKGKATFVVGDASKGEDAKRAIDTAVETYGGLNVLYNNAAIWSAGKIDNYVTELDEDGWETVMSINLKGPFLFCKYGIPAIIKSGGGSVINIASVAGMRGSRMRHHAYAASKGGLITLTKAMAITYARDAVRVNVICPGGIDTPMLQPMLSTEEGHKRFAESHPLGRLGVPEDIAKCALFLASDESDWITGVSVPVDGGVTAA